MLNRKLVATNINNSEIVEHEIPEPHPTGLVVKVSYAGVCHSDAHLYSKPMPKPIAFPIVFGHEISGVVHSVGSEAVENSDEFTVGQRVVVFPWGGCQQCWVCQADCQHCMNRGGPHAHGYGVWMDGGYQTYCSVKSRATVIKVPDAMPMEYACLMPCSAVTAFHAIQEIKSAVEFVVRTNKKANVLLVGAGGLSLWATEMIRAMYSNNVTLMVADIDESKLEDAKSRGADIPLCWGRDEPAEACHQQIFQKFGGPVHAAIDFVGMTSTVERTLGALAFGATLALVGIFGGQMPSIELPRIAITNIRLQGVYCGNKQMTKDVMDFYLKYKLQGPPLQKIKLDEVEGVLQGMVSGQTQKGRAIVDFSD